MDLDQLLTRAEEATCRIEAGQLAVDGGKFERGDLLAEIADVVGEDDLAIECLHRFLSSDPERLRPPAEMTLKGELRVSRAIPVEERSIHWLSWSCYRELAALDAEQRAEVYEISRAEETHSVSGIRLIIARVKGDPAADPISDVTSMPLGQAVRVGLRRHFGGRYAAEDVDEFCDQYERIRAEVEQAQKRAAQVMERAA